MHLLDIKFAEIVISPNEALKSLVFLYFRVLKEQKDEKF